MNIEEQFKDIIIKPQADRLMPFLKTLAPEQKKLLAPLVKKLSKEYSQYGDTGGGSWGHLKGTDKQRSMLQIASFVCLNRADYEKSPSPIWFLDESSLKYVIDWYVPDWFSDYVNKTASLEYFSLDYDWLMQLMEKKALLPSKELLVKSIPQMIFKEVNNEWHYKPEQLEKRSITMDEHIWYLFEVESDLHYADRFLHFGKEVSKEKIGWKHAFVQLSSQGKIDRQRLLKEALLAGNRNFNKVLSGWFAQLFTDLQPTTEELISLQKDIYSILNSPHSKVVNTGLDAVKKILAEKQLDINSFLDAVPVLLSSDTRAVVNATLDILEKIAKNNPTHSSAIALLACRAFIHADDGLQAKAAKLIKANYTPGNTAIHEELQPYLETLYSSAKTIIGDILGAPVTGKKIQSIPVKTGDISSSKEFTPLPLISTIDDLVFLASQAFDNNSPWHISVFPAALVEWQKEMNRENFPKFEPALQRALNMIKKGTNSQQGQLDHMLAVFFIDVCVHWVRKYPTEAKALDDLFEKFTQADGSEVRRWMDIGKDESYLAGWKSNPELSIYIPYKQVLLAALEKIRNNDTLPLLSTPTHEPGWIDPLVLTERLALYEEKNAQPYDMDLQVALARCLLHDTGGASALAEKKLSGEYRNLLLFLFDKHKEPKAPFGYPPAWMTISLTKKEKRLYTAFKSFPWYKRPFEYYIGQHEWKSYEEVYTTNDYDWKVNKTMPVTHKRKIMRISKEYRDQKKNGFLGFISRITGAKEKAPDWALCDCLELKTLFLSIEHNDIYRILLLAPHNPEPLLADTLNHSLKYPTFWQESDKRFVIATLQALHEIWDQFGDMAHVYIATCMLSSDKTVANLAAEIWINGVANNTISSAKIGEAIGRHESIEFAPLKRFTDLVTQHLFRVSDKHNQELQVMVENILKQLPEKPVTNLKKLLEIYGEILSVNKRSISGNGVKEKLEEWRSNAGIKKLVESLIM